MAMLPVAILAGGLATRLRPLTETIPKSMVLINDEPFIYHQLRLLKANGIERVILCLGYLGESIVEHLGDGNQFGLHIDYVFDGPKLLGTGGALKRALPNLGRNFFVIYGDSYLPCSFLEVQKAYQRAQKSALMTIFHNQGAWDHSNIEFSNGEIIAYDKLNKNSRMKHIDYGLGVFSASVFETLPENTILDLAKIYQNLLQQKQLAAFEVKQRFYEVGSFAGITELGHYLCQQKAI